MAYDKSIPTRHGTLILRDYYHPLLNSEPAMTQLFNPIFSRVEYQDGTNKLMYFRCNNCLWTTISVVSAVTYPHPLNPDAQQQSEIDSHKCNVSAPAPYIYPQLTDTSAMAKSRDPNSYNPLIRQILQQAIEHGHYESMPMEEKFAHSLRFDLNGYKKALAASGSPDAESMCLASVSLRKAPDTISTDGTSCKSMAIIEVYPGGPAWTSPDAMAAITAGLEKKQEESQEERMKRLIADVESTSLEN